MKKNTKIALIVLLCAVIAAVAVILIVRGTKKSSSNAPSSTEAANPTSDEPAGADLLPMLTYEVNYPEPTDADFAMLGTDYGENYLFEIGKTLFSSEEGDGWRCAIDFDSANVDTAAATRYMLYYFTDSPIYDDLFSDSASLEYDENGELLSDEYLPEGYYCRYTEENIQFIAQYVFNMEQPFDRAAFLNADVEYGDFAIYENGYYYLSAPGGIEYDFAIPARIKDMKQLEDHKYQFTVEYTSLYDGITLEGEGTLVAALKEVNGIRFWSIYTYQAKVRTVDPSEN